MAHSKQKKSGSFDVHCRSEVKTLKCEEYESVDDIKKKCFNLYEDGKFNDENAIVTYLNEKKTEDILTSTSALYGNNSRKDLFIRFVCIVYLDRCIKGLDNDNLFSA